MITDTPLKLELTRHFDAPPERVFDAWLETSWGEWVGPPGVRGEVTLLEPRVGGRYEVVMHTPDGRTLIVGGTYKEIARPSPSAGGRLVMSWKWIEGDTDTVITLTFRPKDGGTEFTLLHEGFAAPDRRDSHNTGWNGTLDKLAAYLKETA